MNKKELIDEMSLFLEGGKLSRGFEEGDRGRIGFNLIIASDRIEGWMEVIEKLPDIPEGYEVLSDEWVDEHKCRDKSIMLCTEPPKYVEFIKVSDLQNLLIPTTSKSKELEKVVIPKHVATFIKDSGASNILTIINDFTLDDDLRVFIEEYPNEFMRAWLNGYEVEQEQLYTVTLANGKQLIRQGDEIDFFEDYAITYSDPCPFYLTQSEIESVEPCLMQIAIEVE